MCGTSLIEERDCDIEILAIFTFFSPPSNKQKSCGSGREECEGDCQVRTDMGLKTSCRLLARLLYTTAGGRSIVTSDRTPVKYPGAS